MLLFISTIQFVPYTVFVDIIKMSAYRKSAIHIDCSLSTFAALCHPHCLTRRCSYSSYAGSLGELQSKDCRSGNQFSERVFSLVRRRRQWKWQPARATRQRHLLATPTYEYTSLYMFIIFVNVNQVRNLLLLLHLFYFRCSKLLLHIVMASGIIIIDSIRTIEL